MPFLLAPRAVSEEWEGAARCHSCSQNAHDKNVSASQKGHILYYDIVSVHSECESLGAHVLSPCTVTRQGLPFSRLAPMGGGGAITLTCESVRYSILMPDLNICDDPISAAGRTRG